MAAENARSFKLLAEICHLLLELRNISFETHDLLFQLRYSTLIRLRRRSRNRRRLPALDGVPSTRVPGLRRFCAIWDGSERRFCGCWGGDISREQVRITRLFGARLPGQYLYQRRLAAHQLLESRLYLIQIFEAVHPFRSASQLARRLRTAQQQNAQDRRLAPIEVKDLLQAVLVFGHAAVRAFC